MTTTPAIKQQSRLLRKSLKLLNQTDGYTVARKVHQTGNLKWAALDSRALGNYYPSSYTGDNYNPSAPKVISGCANDNAIKSAAQDTISFKGLLEGVTQCH